MYILLLSDALDSPELQDFADTPFFFQEFATARWPPPAADATVQLRILRRQRISPQRSATPRQTAAAGGASASDAAASLDGIVHRVSAAAHAVLGRPVDPQQPLMEAGLDSLGMRLTSSFVRF